MNTAHAGPDGNGSRPTFELVAKACIVVGIVLWIGVVLAFGNNNGTPAVERNLLLGAWVFLPMAVATHAVIDPECSKRAAVMFALASTLPLVGVIPASVYLGTALDL